MGFFSKACLVAAAFGASAMPAVADGWTGGFERGTYYHTLTVKDLQLVVVCDMEETRGQNAGYMSFEIGGNMQMSGAARFNSDAGGQVAAVEYGSILNEYASPLRPTIDQIHERATNLYVDFNGARAEQELEVDIACIRLWLRHLST